MRLNNTLVKVFIFSIFAEVFCINSSASAHEIASTVIYRDTEADSMAQKLSYSGNISKGMCFVLEASRRDSPSLGYNGINEAYMKVNWLTREDNQSSFLIGRSAPNWSIWDGDSVVLAGDAPGFDQIGFTYRKGIADYEQMVGQLSGENRYLLAHRLTLDYKGFRGSVGEIAIADEAFVSNPASHMPLWPYYGTQWVGLRTSEVDNDKVNDNVFLQAMYKWAKGWLIGGELFVDDMPFAKDGKQLTQAAGQLHLEVPAGGKGKITAQYSRVNNFTYSFQSDFGNYSNCGYSLGFPSGPDNDEFKVDYTLPKSFLGLTKVGYLVKRKGEGRFGDVWEPYGYEASKPKEFLSGIVETTRMAYVAGSYKIADNVDFDAMFGVGPVTNLDNKLNSNRLRPEASVGIRASF